MLRTDEGIAYVVDAHFLILSRELSSDSITGPSLLLAAFEVSGIEVRAPYLHQGEQQTPYPSTHDCVRAPIMGAQEDLVLGCLTNARQRIKENYTREEYMGSKGVCAVGAVLAEDGFTTDFYDEETKTLPRYAQGRELLKCIEVQLSQEAKDAIALLNQAALELHPEADPATYWSGPLEWVNQEWGRTEESDDDDDDDTKSAERDQVVKAEILRIYDHAIAGRMAAAV